MKDNILFTSSFKPEIWVLSPSLICHQTQALLVLLYTYCCSYLCSSLFLLLSQPWPFWTLSWLNCGSFSTHLHDSHIASPSGHTSCCSQSGLPETASFFIPFSGNVPSSNIMVSLCGPLFLTSYWQQQISNIMDTWANQILLEGGTWGQHWELLSLLNILTGRTCTCGSYEAISSVMCTRKQWI